MSKKSIVLQHDEKGTFRLSDTLWTANFADFCTPNGEGHFLNEALKNPRRFRWRLVLEEVP